MKITLKLLFLLLSAVWANGTKIHTRIIGGSEAPEGLAPWQVSIRFLRFQHNCGASVIGSTWILTAAHCIYSYQSYFSYLDVVVGTNNREVGGDRYQLSRYILHENYDPKTQANDIALLETTSEIQYGPKVQPIPLANRETQAGESLLLTGWGEMGSDGDVPVMLQMLNLTAITTEECDNRFKAFYSRRNKSFPITEKQLCVDAGEGKGGCKGDSGGPLVNGNMLAGVVSVGIVPCGFGVPDVTTNVYQYRDWINQHTGINT